MINIQLVSAGGRTVMYRTQKAYSGNTTNDVLQLVLAFAILRNRQFINRISREVTDGEILTQEPLYVMTLCLYRVIASFREEERKCDTGLRAKYALADGKRLLKELVCHGTPHIIVFFKEICKRLEMDLEGGILCTVATMACEHTAAISQPVSVNTILDTLVIYRKQHSIAVLGRFTVRGPQTGTGLPERWQPPLPPSKPRGSSHQRRSRSRKRRSRRRSRSRSRSRRPREPSRGSPIAEHSVADQAFVEAEPGYAEEDDDVPTETIATHREPPISRNNTDNFLSSLAADIRGYSTSERRYIL